MRFNRFSDDILAAVNPAIGSGNCYVLHFGWVGKRSPLLSLPGVFTTWVYRICWPLQTSQKCNFICTHCLDDEVQFQIVESVWLHIRNSLGCHLRRETANQKWFTSPLSNAKQNSQMWTNCSLFFFDPSECPSIFLQ